MFEKFTENALSVILAAQKESKQLNDNFVGTEHILLGLLIENSASAQILNSFGINLEKTRNEIVQISCKGSGGGDVKTPFVGSKELIPFSVFAKELLKMALSEAMKREQPVTQLHLLLALTCINGKHVDIFKNLNIDVDKINKYTTEKVNNIELKLKNHTFIFSFGYILFMIVLLIFSYALLNNLIVSLRLTCNNLIAMIAIVIITFFVRNNLIFNFGFCHMPVYLARLIRIVCLIIGILFISVLILAIAISVMIFIGKYRYS